MLGHNGDTINNGKGNEDFTQEMKRNVLLIRVVKQKRNLQYWICTGNNSIHISIEKETIETIDK